MNADKIVPRHVKASGGNQDAPRCIECIAREVPMTEAIVTRAQKLYHEAGEIVAEEVKLKEQSGRHIPGVACSITWGGNAGGLRIKRRLWVTDWLLPARPRQGTIMFA